MFHVEHEFSTIFLYLNWTIVFNYYISKLIMDLLYIIIKTISLISYIRLNNNVVINLMIFNFYFIFNYIINVSRET